MPRKRADYAGRLALSLLGISEDAYDQIVASHALPPELAGEYTLLHRLALLETRVETIMVMHEAIIAMSGIDMDKFEATIKTVLDAQEKRGEKGAADGG